MGGSDGFSGSAQCLRNWGRPLKSGSRVGLVIFWGIFLLPLHQFLALDPHRCIWPRVCFGVHDSSAALPTTIFRILRPQHTTAVDFIGYFGANSPIPRAQTHHAAFKSPSCASQGNPTPGNLRCRGPRLIAQSPIRKEAQGELSCQVPSPPVWDRICLPAAQASEDIS